MAKHRSVNRTFARTAARLGCLTLAGGPLLMLSVPTALAGSMVTAGDQAESWYTIAPADACSAPIGCPPATVPSSPYPTDTLHVGVAAGQETARTYLVIDMSAVPFDATATSGTMTLPLASDQQSGVVQPAAAHLAGCLAKAAAADGVQGTPTTPPAVDTTVCVDATYSASSSTFSLDLSPFLSAWASGKPQDGIALMASPSKTAQTDAWHVAFNDRKRAGQPHISSSITYTAAPATPFDNGLVSQPTTAAVVPPVSSVPPNLGTPSTTSVAPTGPAPQVAAAPPAAPASQPVAFSRGFQYPAVFLMPIALLAVAVFFVRLFTRDPLPLEARR
jgi:hypothetical protein